MKANEAPERIILSADRDTQIINDEWVVNDYTDNIKIEYIRTDAFIEKACEFIEQNITGYIDVTHKGGEENIILQSEFIEDFKNYIKEK